MEDRKPQIIKIKEQDIQLVLEVLQNQTLALLHCSATEWQEDSVRENQKDWFSLVELQAAGEDQDDHHGSKYTGTLPGRRLIYDGIKDYRNQQGRKLEIRQADPLTGLKTVSHIQFTDNCNVLETWTSVTNEGEDEQVLTYVSSFVLAGLTKSAQSDWNKAAAVKIPHNTWYGEFQWRDYTLPQLGLDQVFHYSTKRISFSAAGTWNSHEYLPMGYVRNTETKEGWYFSILHNGSWHWEISDSKDALYLQVSGPTEAECHWSEALAQGESFHSVHVAVALTKSGFENAVMEMTKYRRSRRRPNKDNEILPVIFNDFMNCLGGDPTQEKEYPLIDAASEAGCEYYTIDAGWYANGSWWSRVGEWEPSEIRFPDGIDKVLAYIREKGMIPGLWLELEVMGIHCPIAAEKPDDWFFCRHGRRVIDHGRYQLDYRNPAVREFAHEVVRRLVSDYGAGYIKMDYNINAGIGTELAAYSAGAGLLAHNRAYLQWLDEVFIRYPDLIIENCGSGGMRINDDLLQRHSIQSSSDQTDYIRYAKIAAAAPAAVTPEQNAVWSYPLADADEEAVVFNMVNAMLMRIHQSGDPVKCSRQNMARIKEGLGCYKTYRRLLKEAYPFWPLGLPKYEDQWVMLGLRSDTTAFLAVWNTGEAGQISFEASGFLDTVFERIYPKGPEGSIELDTEAGNVTVIQPAKSARLYCLTTDQNKGAEQ